VSASGFSYPIQQSLIPIPANNGAQNLLVRGGTFVKSITLAVQTAGSSGTIDVGDDSGGTRYVSRGDLTKAGATESTLVGAYYTADNHIRVASTGANGVVGYVAVAFQHVAVSSAW
jgi:hypothetical protein